jgi:hypothetical protein
VVHVTGNPTAEWIARQITEAFLGMTHRAIWSVIGNRVYGAVVTGRLRAMGIRDKLIAPALPWQALALPDG